MKRHPERSSISRVLELSVFRRLLATTVLTEIAVSMGAVALAVLVYRRTGSAVGAAGFFLCAEFGPALFSPFFVARLDQASARRVLVGLYLSEALIFLLLSWLVGHFSLVSILILALLDGVLALTAKVLTRAVWTSATTAVGQMREANALINSALSLCYMVGPALGGVVVAVGGTRTALLVNVGLFVLMALTIATATGLPHAVAERVRAAGRLKAALAEARKEPMIRRVLGLQAAGMVFFTISIPVEVVFAQHTLHVGATGYGVLLSAWGGGAVLGSAIYARWRERPSRTMITLGCVFLGVGFVVIAVAPTLAVAIIGSSIAGLGNGIEIVAARTALQEAVPERWMALILSFNESVLQAVPGVGILLGGAIAAIAGPRAAFAVAAAGSFVVAGAVWLRLRTSAPARGVDLAPEIPPPRTHHALTTSARQS
jgi:MFS family permease